MCAIEYDLGNDVMYTAHKRGSILLNTMLQGVGQGVSGTTDRLPNIRWLLVAQLYQYRHGARSNQLHVDTARLYAWQHSSGSSMVFERWRDTKSSERSLHVYLRSRALMTCGTCRRSIRNIDYCGKSGASQIAGLLVWVHYVR